MASRDLFHRTKTVQSVAPLLRTATVTGSAVDTQGFESATVELDIGAITDGTFTPSLSDSPDNVTYTAVAAAQLLGSFAAALHGTGESTVQSVGYGGPNRYLKVVYTVTGSPVTGGTVGAVVVLGHPRHADTETTQK